MEDQVAWMLQSPPPDAATAYFAKVAEGLGVEVRLDAGGAKGKGVFAVRPFSQGAVIFQEPPLVGIQHSDNRDRAWVCACCFRFVGGIAQQLGRAAVHCCGDAAQSSSGAAAGEHLEGLAAGAVELPFADMADCPPAVPCQGTGPAQSELQEFYAHADETNDVFRLAAQVVATTLLGAERHGAGSVDACSDPELHWQALQRAWQPFSMGHKGRWWECVALPPDVDNEAQFRADFKELASDSLQLLVAALRLRRPDLCTAFPAALDLAVWGSVIGMFELNNLSLFVASPVPGWAEAVGDLPEGEQAAALQAAAPALAALGGLEAILEEEEEWACQGNAYYALQACCNHSCVPNAHAFKREEDIDGAAVILALREVSPGEEVTISYVDAEAPLEERVEALRDYGFECTCEKCNAEHLAAELLLE